MRLKIIGPPGTGKTTKVLQYIKEYAQRDDVGMICASAFTVSASKEMESRVLSQLDHEAQKKVKCATIHSLAFEHIGIKKHFMVNTLYAFAKDQGERSLIIDDRRPMNAKTPLEKAISHYHIARIQMYSQDMPLPKGLSEELYQHYVQEFEKYKAYNKFFDYTDVLIRYMNDGVPLDFDVAIIDEAQDLSMLQVQVTNKMFQNCRDVITAGDDDQTIYAFAGVRAKDYIEWPCDKQIVLEKSHRLGKNLHKYSQHVLDRIETRIDKTYLPGDHADSVEISNSLVPEVDLFPYKSSAILHRNGYLVKKTRELLNKMNVTYSGKGSPFSYMTAMKAIRYWEEWRTGKQMYGNHIHLIAKFLPEEFDMDRMEDKGRKSMAPPCPCPLKQWHEILELPFKEVYMGVQQAYGLGYLLAKPKIEVTTIHQAKGGEWDKVVVVPDMSTATWKEFKAGGNQDAEHRVWYVALTRAKLALQVLRPRTPKHYPLQEDL